MIGSIFVLSVFEELEIKDLVHNSDNTGKEAEHSSQFYLKIEMHRSNSSKLMQSVHFFPVAFSFVNRMKEEKHRLLVG